MSERSWFYAVQGQQQGPIPEAQLRQLIAAGTVAADTLVWCDGMTDWQRAGDIPGLSAAGSRPPAVTQPDRPPVDSPYTQPGGPLVAADELGGERLSFNFGIGEFIWRSLVAFIGLAFVIPLPWVITMFLRFLVSSTHVPSRPDLAFTGKAVTLILWLVGSIVVVSITAYILPQQLQAIVTIGIEFLLNWLLIRWIVAHIRSSTPPLSLRFTGSFWGYLGWTLLAALSIFTIVGWAWVYVAQIRWMCRHIEGTRRDIVFTATGLEFLWRALVTMIACSLLIPMPWAIRWFANWQASQVRLVERGAVFTA